MKVMNKWQHNLKFRILAGVIILVIAFSLGVYPGFLRASYGQESLSNYESVRPRQEDTVTRLKQERSTLETAFKQHFLLTRSLGEAKREYTLVPQWLDLKNRTEVSPAESFLLADQLLWAEYLAQRGEHGRLDQWLEMINDLFRRDDRWVSEIDGSGAVLQWAMTDWPDDLKIARIQLIAYNEQPNRNRMKQIREIMARIKPEFEAKQLSADQHTRFERILYPLTSSKPTATVNPDTFKESPEGQFIRLSSIDLWVLQSFALLDSAWEGIYNTWLQRVRGAGHAETSFYSLGIWPDASSYVATAGKAFSVSLADTLLTAEHLLEVGQHHPRFEGFVTRELTNRHQLLTSYHMIDESPLSEQVDLVSTAILSGISARIGRSDLIQLCRKSLDYYQANVETSPLRYLYYHAQNDQMFRFHAVDQLAVLLADLH